MKINYLELINFRNHENLRIEFSENNLIIGENGTGKTSILEAITILATARSPITRGINKCIKHRQQGFIVSGNFSDPAEEKLNIIFKQQRDITRTIKVNDQILKKSSELLGLLNSVIFLPNDIGLIQGSPQERRKYLDILISQLDKNYYQQLQKEAQILKQRNTLLKAIRDGRQKEAELDSWDEQLLLVAEKIYQERQKIIAQLSAKTASWYQRIGFQQKIELTYKSAFSLDSKQNRASLQKQRQFDIISGTTNYGVHRDDLNITCRDLPAAEFCSQGQQRLLVVCLKLAEAELKKENLKDAPLLLIDDVLLELDLLRFNNLLRETLQTSQKIFTVTDTRRFDPQILTNLKIINL